MHNEFFWLMQIDSDLPFPFFISKYFEIISDIFMVLFFEQSLDWYHCKKGTKDCLLSVYFITEHCTLSWNFPRYIHSFSLFWKYVNLKNLFLIWSWNVDLEIEIEIEWICWLANNRETCLSLTRTGEEEEQDQTFSCDENEQHCDSIFRLHKHMSSFPILWWNVSEYLLLNEDAVSFCRAAIGLLL